MTDSTGPDTLYHGMEWLPRRGGSFQAFSDTTGGTYIVEPDATGTLWGARWGFPERPGRPFVEVGRHPDRDTARTACERHDYRFWKNAVGRTGARPVFVGSSLGASPLAALTPQEADEIGAMLEHEEPSDGARFVHAASFFSSQKTALKQEKNGSLTLTVTLEAQAIPRWLLEASPGTDMLMAAVETGAAQDTDWQERGSRAVRRAFALPVDPTFQHWLLHRYDRWRLVAGAVAGGTSEAVEEAAAETLRRLLSCPTRKALSRDRDAIERLEALDREYYTDLSRGFGSVTGA